MDWLVSLLTGPVIVAAIISSAVAVTGFFISRGTLLRMHREKLFDDIDMAKRKVELDLESAARKRQQELAEEVLAGFYEAQSARSCDFGQLEERCGNMACGIDLRSARS